MKYRCTIVFRGHGFFNHGASRVCIRGVKLSEFERKSRCPGVKLSSRIQRQINPQPPPPVPVLPDQGIGNVKFIPRKSQNLDVIDYFDDDL